MIQRFFTVEEAEALLPELTVALGDVRDAALEGSVESLDRAVRDRLLSLGIRFPVGGIEHGLVDFPTRFEGRTVYLCWRLGEERILAWHEMDAGFTGRRPLTSEVARAMGMDPDDE